MMNDDRNNAITEQSSGTESADVLGQSLLSNSASGLPRSDNIDDSYSGGCVPDGGDWGYQFHDSRLDDPASSWGRFAAGYGEPGPLRNVAPTVPLDSLVWILTCFCIGYWLMTGINYISRKIEENERNR